MKKRNKNDKNRHIHKKITSRPVQKPSSPTLSICMIVKNEEENLPRLLNSIQGLYDELIIVDTGSTDNTVEIAKSFGAKVYCFEWCDNFSAARNESLRHATKDYILWLDADDELKKEEHIKIRYALSKYRGYAFYLRLINFTDQGDTESIQMRMFPRREDIRFEGSVHEQVYPSIERAKIPMTLCDAVIIHHGYKESGDNDTKLKRNLEILKKDLAREPDNILTLFFLGRTLRGLNQLEDSVSYYDRIIEKGRDDNKLRATDLYQITLFERAGILATNGRLKEAINLLEDLGNAGKNNIIDFTIGELYYKSKEYEKAYKYLYRIKDVSFKEELVPLDLKLIKKNLYKYLGVSSLFVRDYNTAKRYIGHLIDHDPQDPQNYHYLALCEEKQGNIKKAIDICSKAIERFYDDISFVKKRFLLRLENGYLEDIDKDLPFLEDNTQDLDVLCGLFLLSSLKLSVDGITKYYNAIQRALFLPVLPFPEGYLDVKNRLNALDEKKALSLLDRAVDNLLNLNTSITA